MIFIGRFSFEKDPFFSCACAENCSIAWTQDTNSLALSIQRCASEWTMKILVRVDFLYFLVVSFEQDRFFGKDSRWPIIETICDY